MKRLRITSMEGISGRDETKEFEKFGLRVGDIIDAKKFTSNSYWYQPKPGGEVLFIYSHNVSEIEICRNNKYKEKDGCCTKCGIHHSKHNGVEKKFA